MKKILVLAVVFALFTGAASAQKAVDGIRPEKTEHFRSGQFTKGEKAKMHRNHKQYKKTAHRFKHDGRISSSERKRLHHMKHHDRKQAYRYKNNHHQKV